MKGWTLEQRVDIARDPEHPKYWYGALMERGDDRAHTWRVTLLENGEPCDLAGCSANAYLNRDIAEDTVLAAGEIEGNVVSVRLPAACYAVPGGVTGLLRLSLPDGTVMTAAAACWQIGEGSYDAIVDPSGRIPSLEDLLARVGEMEAATKAAQSAAGEASAAASAVGSAVTDAQEAAKAARQAQEDADKAREALTDKWDDVSLECEVLPPNADPYARLEQSEHDTKFLFGMPHSNLGYSSFEVNDNMELVMTSPEDSSDITFSLGDDGHLYLEVQ